MFDGKTLAGWHSYQKTSITENGWIIKDSAIYLRGPAAGALLAPDAFVYKNFEISIDWKLPDSGNSGIFLRYLETEPSPAKRTGPETQICGKLNVDYKNGQEDTSPGACYDMYAPSQPWIRSAQEYNTLHIVMFEEKVAHFGNGIKLLEYTIGSPDWKARYDTSKYNQFPLYGDIHAGKLFLQDHASHVWYRNIRIRPLSSDPWSDPGFIWPNGVRILAPFGPASRGVRIRPSAGGGLTLIAGSARGWDLALYDPSGRRQAVLRGTGSRIGTDAALSAGAYLLSGRIDGSRFEAPVLLPGR